MPTITHSKSLALLSDAFCLRIMHSYNYVSLTLILKLSVYFV